MRTVIHTGSQLVLTGDTREVAIECVDGNLWVTVEGDPADHILGRGERVIVDRRGRVVVSSLLEGEVAVVGGRKGVLGRRPWSARLAVPTRPQRPRSEAGRRQVRAA
jgi:hypothetical protein